MISRRAFLGSAGGPLILSRSAAAAPPAPPNIVFFYTDDQSMWSLGAHGNPHSYTPNMDRIGQQGVVFDNSFVTTPVCSPARGGMFTSRHSFELGIPDWINEQVEPDAGLAARFPTWVEQLHKAGYRTGLFGKWHLGSRPQFHPTRRGYDVFYGFLGGSNRPKDPVLEVDGATKEVPGFLPDLLTDRAIGFVRDNRARPFVVSLHFRAPHMPYLPVPEQDARLFEGVMLDLPDYTGVDPSWLQNNRGDYYKSIASVDRNVGRMLAELSDLSLEGKTLVIFASDNGYMIGQHGLNTKGNASWVAAGRKGRRPNMFDYSLRVPLLMRWPGVITPGRRVSEMVLNLDYLPTILEGCRAPLPDGYGGHGKSLMPVLAGTAPPSARRAEFYGDYHMIHGYDETMRMVRTPHWKLITHRDPHYLDELYNLEEDPGEQRNLIGEAGARKHKERLEEKLARWQARVNDPEQLTPREPKQGPFLN